MQINITYARTLTDMADFLRYIVSIYGKEIYKDKQRLFNLIADLYAGEERQKRLFRRAIIEDNMAQRIYELEKKTLSERKAMADAIASRFAENNFFPNEIGQKVILTFVQGLNLLLKEPWKIPCRPAGEFCVRTGKCPAKNSHVPLAATRPSNQSAWTETAYMGEASCAAFFCPLSWCAPRHIRF